MVLVVSMYKYPIYAKSNNNGQVIRFTGLTEGTVVVKGGNINNMDVGEFSRQWAEHTNRKIWKIVENPQSNTNKMLKALKDS